jgi:hypothetical protein
MTWRQSRQRALETEWLAEDVCGKRTRLRARRYNVPSSGVFAKHELNAVTAAIATASGTLRRGSLRRRGRHCARRGEHVG